jgi:hypothetical protein
LCNLHDAAKENSFFLSQHSLLSHSGALSDVVNSHVEIGDVDVLFGHSSRLLRRFSVRFTERLLLLRPPPDASEPPVVIQYSALRALLYAPKSSSVFLLLEPEHAPGTVWAYAKKAHFDPHCSTDRIKSSIQLTFLAPSFRSRFGEASGKFASLRAAVDRAARFGLRDTDFVRHYDDSAAQDPVQSQPRSSPSPSVESAAPPPPPPPPQQERSVRRLNPVSALAAKTPNTLRTFSRVRLSSQRKAAIDLADGEGSDVNGDGSARGGDDAPPLLVYPPPPNDKNSVTLTTYDLERLKPGEFLNDTLIEFYLLHLMIAVLTPEQRARCYMFNTFFFDKIASGRSGDGKYYADVARWTKHVDLFSKDFILIPINEHAHWRLIVVCFPGELLVEVPPAGAEPSPPASQSDHGSGGKLLPRGACLLGFDSLGGGGGGAFRVIRDYLMRELLDKRPDVMSPEAAQKRFDADHLVAATVTVPEQNNVYDCGLFVLQYAELLLTRADELFSPTETTARPKRHALTALLTRHGHDMWFDQSLITRKRKEMRKLIERLARESAANADAAATATPARVDGEDEFVDVA